MSRIPVAILGATGTVGQKFVRLLDGHPWFEIVAVAASEQSVGRPYGDLVRWREPGPVPESVASLVIQRCAPPLDVTIVFSAIEAEIAGEVEQTFARSGAYVVTNTKTHRMAPDVPLIVPEVNAAHLDLLNVQHKNRAFSGGIVANPNCSTVGLVLALAPLHQIFGVERVFVSTMQAVSGAGYPGVASLDILGNVIPYIGEEEEKIEREAKKLLGTLSGDGVQEARVAVSAHTSRVAVIDGHMATVSVGLSQRATPEQAIAAWTGFRGDETVRGLPSSPAHPVEVDLRLDRPQPRLDLERGAGMTVTVGRVRHCPLLDLRFVTLAHNTVRGAAGAAIQNAELLVTRGFVERPA